MEAYTDDENKIDVDKVVSEKQEHVSGDNYPLSSQEIGAIKNVSDIIKPRYGTIKWYAKTYPSGGLLEKSTIFKLILE